MNNSDPNEDVGDYQKLADAATKVNKTVEFVNAMQKEADAIAQQKLTEIAGIEAKIEGAEALELAIDKNRSISTGNFTFVCNSRDFSSFWRRHPNHQEKTSNPFVVLI
jgi:hypothetical protein